MGDLIRNQRLFPIELSNKNTKKLSSKKNTEQLPRLDDNANIKKHCNLIAD